MKKHLINFLLVIVSCSIPLVLAEYVFKKGLFDKTNKGFNKYRDQNLYASKCDENFWKLYHIFSGKEAIGRNAMIGWTYPSYYNGNFFHQNVPLIKKRRATLLYGDSFAQCVKGTETFQDIINADSNYNKNNFFINYGTGAFGVDQIYTLFRNSYQKFNNPIVVFSFMTEDLDRSVLQLREGLKPFYKIEEDSLVFIKQDYIGNFDAFIQKNPITIKSLLWRKFLYSDVNFLSDDLTALLTGELSNREKVIALNRKILQEAVNELRHSNTDFIFLVFNSIEDILTPTEKNWRLKFVSEFVESNKINAIYTKDLLPSAEKRDSTWLLNFYIENDGHPNSNFNRIISNRIVSEILNERYERNSSHDRIQYPYTYENLYDSVIRNVYSNQAVLKQSEENAKRDKISLDSAVKKMANWMIWDKYEKK
ncbi:MAG TPA: hypothetical protein PKN75_00930 [Bacteroidia bacterium]|nr:hypothetical protein [Bacteroidia bacterium]HNU32136.1 hypothetical protein [Bacteroidia bacterium]